MRRGFLLAVLSLGALALFALMLISSRRGTTFTAQRGSTASGDGAQTVEAQAPKEINFAQPPELPPGRLLAIAPAKEKTSEESFADGRDEQHEAQVAARIAELGNLSTKTDRASRETLLSEVKNPDHEIRQAALDAISQSGNRAAIPGLREAAAQTEDSREKKAIEEVIEFINLPTLTELLSRRGATNNQRPAQEQP
ncbi:MAG TPA: HEAT repeat domain-containing protein [Verrucomicrobiae bacterium]